MFELVGKLKFEVVVELVLEFLIYLEKLVEMCDCFCNVRGKLGVV